MNNNLESYNTNCRFWLTLDKLPYEDICNLARGFIPTQLRTFGYSIHRLFNNCPYYSLLMNGISIKKITTSCNGKASPLECFLYFHSKKLPLPKEFVYLLENDLDEIQKNLKKKINRSKQSYQRKEVRGDEDILEGVLKTLLDLYPDYPKEKLITLKPVQEYANGFRHSEAYLKGIIADIEKRAGKIRKSGNVTTEIKES